MVASLSAKLRLGRFVPVWGVAMRLWSAPSVWEERAGVEDCFVVQPVFISVTSSHLWGDVFINVPLPDQ